MAARKAIPPLTSEWERGGEREEKRRAHPHVHAAGPKKGGGKIGKKQASRQRARSSQSPRRIRWPLSGKKKKREERTKPSGTAEGISNARTRNFVEKRGGGEEKGLLFGVAQHDKRDKRRKNLCLQHARSDHCQTMRKKKKKKEGGKRRPQPLAGMNNLEQEKGKRKRGGGEHVPSIFSITLLLPEKREKKKGEGDIGPKNVRELGL